MKKPLLQITALVLTGILGASLLADQRRRKRDQLAGKLLTEIQRLTNPGSAGILSEDAFDPAYPDRLLQSVNGRVIVMAAAAAGRTAQMIESAWGFWNDDEAQVYSAFRGLRDKVQVAQVAGAYQSQFGVSLLDTLSRRLDDEELQTVLDIVAGLPPYRLMQS